MKNKISKIILMLSFIAISFGNLFAQTSAAPVSEGDKIIGVWEVGSGKARVKVTKYGEKYAGKMVWLLNPTYEDGTPKIDKNNPDETKRNVPLLGYSMLLGFEYTGDKKYENGTIYDPESGSTYHCTISMIDENTLDVRGYIGVQMFGRTDKWKRVIVKK